MGDTWMHFFPADPLQPKPDWTRLRGELLQCRFILEPRGADIPAETVVSLWLCIATATGLQNSGKARTASLDDLIAILSSTGCPIDRWALDTARLTIPEFLEALQTSGALPANFVFAKRECYLPGPLFEGFCDVPHSRYGWTDHYLYTQDFGDRIGIEVGENTLIPPGIPGTERVVEEWGEFLERWINDPHERWTDPETGRQYGLLDLEWENSLGAGTFMLSVFSPGYLSGDRAARLLSELAGQSFRYSWKHI
jgi:hypothetical protein